MLRRAYGATKKIILASPATQKIKKGLYFV